MSGASVTDGWDVPTVVLLAETRDEVEGGKSVREVTNQAPFPLSITERTRSRTTEKCGRP